MLRDAFPEAPLLDARGKRHEWQAVVILPFVRVADLEAALAPLQLDDDEAARDRVGAAPLLFCSPAAPLAWTHCGSTIGSPSLSAHASFADRGWILVATRWVVRSVRSPAYAPPSARTEFSRRARSAWGRPVEEIWIVVIAPANCGRARAPKWRAV